MNYNDIRISFKSIRFKLVIAFISVMVPFIALLVYNNFYAISVVRNKVAESNKNMIALYLMQIDNRLDDAGKYLDGLRANDADLDIMDNYTDEN